MKIIEFPVTPAKESPQVEKTRLKLLQQLNEVSHIFESVQVLESSPQDIMKKTSPIASDSPTVQKIRKILEERYFPQGK